MHRLGRCSRFGRGKPGRLHGRESEVQRCGPVLRLLLGRRRSKTGLLLQQRSSKARLRLWHSKTRLRWLLWRSKTRLRCTKAGQWCSKAHRECCLGIRLRGWWLRAPKLPLLARKATSISLGIAWCRCSAYEAVTLREHCLGMLACKKLRVRQTPRKLGAGMPVPEKDGWPKAAGKGSWLV